MHRIAQESDEVSLTCLVCLYHADQFPQDIYVCSYLFSYMYFGRPNSQQGRVDIITLNELGRSA